MTKISDKKYNLEQVMSITGISKRNIKFWSNVYNIKPEKIGRSNYYSEKLLQLLKMISFLSESLLFTQKFIKLLIDFNLNRLPQNSYNYHNFYTNFSAFLKNNSELKNLNFNFIPAGILSEAFSKKTEDKLETPPNSNVVSISNSEKFQKKVSEPVQILIEPKIQKQDFLL